MDSYKVTYRREDDSWIYPKEADFHVEAASQQSAIEIFFGFFPRTCYIINVRKIS